MPIFEMRMIGIDEIEAAAKAAPEVIVAEETKAMRDSTLIVERNIKALTPRRTGRLQAAWGSEVERRGVLIGKVLNPVSYGPFVEENTRPHVIEAKNATTLAIPIKAGGGFGGARLDGRRRAGQGVAFIKKVNHPGTKGQHMARRGLEASRTAIEERFAAALRAVLATLGR